MNMLRVHLQTSDGKFVHSSEMPPWPDKVPDVIGWDERLFVLYLPNGRPDELSQAKSQGVIVYREAFTFWVK